MKVLIEDESPQVFNQAKVRAIQDTPPPRKLKEL